MDCCGIRQAETQNKTDEPREIVRMPKPEVALVKKWRDLAEEGYLYAETVSYTHLTLPTILLV